jgi:PAS domain S-box-containing protein
VPMGARKLHPLQRWLLLPWAVGAFACVILVFAGVNTQRWERAGRQRDFAAAVAARTRAFQTSLDADRNVLSAIAGLFNASEEVTRHEFHTFTAPYFDLSNGNRYYRVLAWVPRVPASDRASYERTTRSQGFPAFGITERTADGVTAAAGKRGECFPIGYLEPVSGNRVLLGYDMASSPQVRLALSRARDSGQSSATEPILLPPGLGGGRRLFVCTPIYRGGRIPSTVAGRREALAGFAVGAYAVADMLDKMVASRLPRGLEVAVFAGNTAAGGSPLRGRMAPHAALRTRDTVRVGDRQWLVIWQGTRRFAGVTHWLLAWVVIGGGTLLTALAVGMLAFVQARAQQAEEEAERVRLILHTSMDGFILLDVSGRVVEVNPNYCQMVGYSREELLSMSIADVEANEYREQVARHIRAVREGGNDRFETRHRRKDGVIIDVEISTSLCQSPAGDLFVAFVRDFTEGKAAEESLRSSERKYRTLIENLPQRIFLKDRNSVYVSGNANYARDLSTSPEELAGRADYDFFPRELADKYRADDRRIMDSGETEELEERYVAGGREAWVHTVKTPVRDDHGEVAGILGIFWDITERKQTERALRESEQRFRGIVEVTSDFVWEVDEAARYTYASPVVADILGRAPEEILGKTPFDLMPPEEANRVAGIFGPVAAAREPFAFLENTNLHKDGREVVLETSGIPIFDSDGRFKGYRGVDRDITERKRAEARVAWHAQVQAGLAEVAARLLGEHDLDAVSHVVLGHCQQLTDSAMGLVGYVDPADGAMVMPTFPGEVWDQCRVADKTYRFPASEALWARPWREGQTVVANDVATDPRSTGIPPGHPAIRRFLGVPAATGGEVVGLIGLANKASEYTRADCQVAEAFASLWAVAVRGRREHQALEASDQRHRSLAEELGRANEELKSLDRMKNDFVSLVGHELRTPLAGILGYAEFLLEEDLSASDVHEFAAIIYRESERLTRLVNAVLDLNKMEAGRMEYHKVGENLNDIVRVAASAMESAAGRRHQRLSLALASEDLTAEFDPDRIQQVMLNLLSNAVKFSPEHSEIEIGTRRDDGHVVAWVRDQGMGLDPQDLSRIFGKFVQANQGAKRVDGTGLGLPICKNIVEGGHGGQMWAESPGPGRGATFYFQLPRKAADASTDC